MSGTTPAPVTVAPDTPCEGTLGEQGWMLYNDHCYKVYPQVSEMPMSWHDAHSHCHNEGSDLLSILDEDENKFVVSLVSNGLDKMMFGSHASYLSISADDTRFST